VKTAFTKHSGRCLVSAAEQNGVRFVAVTLNAPDDWQDHRTLLDHGFSRYEAVTLASPGEYTAELPCVGSESGTVTAANAEELTLVLPVGTEITHTVESRGLLFPPIHTGEPLGLIRFFAGEEAIAALPLLAAEDIEQPEAPHGQLRQILEKLLNW